jgi:hypothetical protein
MRIRNSLVIIPVINQDRIFALEPESQPPIAAHSNGPVAFQVSTQRMQPPTGRIHIFRGPCVVEREELVAQPIRVGRLDSRFRPCAEEQLDSLVTKAPNHSYSV